MTKLAYYLFWPFTVALALRAVFEAISSSSSAMTAFGVSVERWFFSKAAFRKRFDECFPVFDCPLVDWMVVYDVFLEFLCLVICASEQGW